jgi:hypothetical protein
MARKREKTKVMMALETERATREIDGVRRSKVFTREEIRKQLEFVEGLFSLSGANAAPVIAAAIKPPPAGLGITATRAARLIARVREAWAESDKANSDAKRQAAERRILRNIQANQGRRDPRNPAVWLEKPDYAAIARFEAILMKIQGTAAPERVEVNVSVSQTLTAVFARYPLERLRELHAAAEAKHKLAQKYLAEHPEARQVIEAEGVRIE